MALRVPYDITSYFCRAQLSYRTRYRHRRCVCLSVRHTLVRSLSFHNRVAQGLQFFTPTVTHTHTHTHNFIHQSIADTKYRYKC